MKRLLLLVLPVLLLGAGGCGSSGNGAPSHTAEEERAVREAQSLTPEQQIQRAEANTSMPAAQKEALIRSIKEKNGLK